MVLRPNITAASTILGEKILCFLHYRYAHSEKIVFTIKELTDSVGGANPRVLSYAASDLEDTELVDIEYFSEEHETTAGYSINKVGIKVVEAWDEEKYLEVSRGIDFLEETNEYGSSSMSLETGGDVWQPLPLENSGQAYERAVQAVDEAVETIVGNNGYAESEPQEREQVVWSIRQGLEAIKSGVPTKEQVIGLLVRPLKYVAAKFATAAMGEAARGAVIALLKWIGLSG